MPEPRSEPGRNPGDARHLLRIGIDLGGTKIETALLDATGRFLHRQRIATPKTPAAIVAAIVAEVAHVEAVFGPAASVGVATPGSISARTALLRNSNTVCLNGLPIDRMLAQALGRPVRIANDANCLALSEAVDGAAGGAAVVFGVILGTGVGGGMVIEGRVISGCNAIAGEWGHNPLPWPRDEERPGAPCYCGRSGCIETFLSGPALAADHARNTGQDKSAAAIADAACRGDPEAAAAIARYMERLARALATVVNVLDPDVIVLGGGVSNLPGIETAVASLWQPYIFSDAVATRIVTAMHGDSSGVRGAAWLWDRMAR